MSSNHEDLASASEGAGAPGELVGLPSTYDELVKRSPQGSIFAERWWLEAVAPGMYEIFEIRDGGGIHAAWPVVHRKADGEKHVCMPALTQKLGILFAPSRAKPVEIQSTNQKLAAELIDELGEANSFYQNFHENFTDWLPFYWRGYAQTTRYTGVLEDISDTNALWNNMRHMSRKEIRKAQKLGIRIADDLQLDQLLDLNRKTFARQGKNPLANDEFVHRLDAACAKNAGRKTLTAVDQQGKVHAAVYIVWDDHTAYSILGCSDPELRNSSAYRLAFWEAVVFASTVVKRFDFIGSMLPQVEPVPRGFGAKQLPYFSISKIPPGPTSLGGFLKEAVRFRVRRARKAIKSRFNK